jgi:peptide/nickel transport system substrate-binding protein
MRPRRPAVLLAVLLLGLSWGCKELAPWRHGASAPHGDRERPADTLVLGRGADAIGFDPARFTDNESIEVCEQVYEHLVRLKPGSTDVEPSLATDWSVSDDGRVWTLHLRKGVKFHDGTPFDAEAVRFSFERQLRDDHPYHRDDFTNWKNSFANVVREIEVVDPYTVRITVYKSYAPFLASLAMFPVSIVSPTAVRKWGDAYTSHPVGTGPFRFVEWIPGDRVVIERNDDYWGPRPRLRRVVFKVIPDARQRLVALEGGTLDVAYGILPAELQFVELHPEQKLYRAAGDNVAYMAMNTMHPGLSDVRVRRALNYAVNKGPIVKLVYQGLGVPAIGALPPSLWAHDDKLYDYPYDPAKARELLVQAAADGAWDGRTLTFYAPRTPRTYLPDPEAVARAIQKNLDEIGIKTELVLEDLGPHIASVERGEHDLCLLGWAADIPDPDNFLYLLFSRDNAQIGSARNVAFYQDAEVSGLLQYAQETADRDERERYYIKAQERIAQDAPWVPLAHAQVVVAARKDVQGLVISTPSIVYYDTVWIGQ